MKLRPLTINDIDFLLEVRNDDSTRRFLENDSIFTYDESLNWFNTTKPNWFIIEVNNERVGYIRTNGDEVGCDIHPNFRRKGYARQAYLEYLKDKSYATLWVFENNFAKNLYKSLGFIETGEVKIIRNQKYIFMKYERRNS
jgi:ribosomal protein S18 acetylase RimI-like enzyme